MAEYAKKSIAAGLTLQAMHNKSLVLSDHRPVSATTAFQMARQLRDARSASSQASTTGQSLPGTLKSGIESLSGMSMDHVQVHYNSAKPAQLNAHAYAQGSQIHLGPGQAQHLPHEAWHVVQQAQGRVKPTMQMKTGVPVNDDKGLEHEADVMGARALTQGSIQRQAYAQTAVATTNPASVRYTAAGTAQGIVQGRWPSMTEMVMGGLGILGGGLVAAATAATAPVTIPALAAIGGVAGALTGTGIDYLRGTGAYAAPSAARTTPPSAGGAGKPQNIKPKAQAASPGAVKAGAHARVVTTEVIKMIAKNTGNLIASKGAAQDRPKREKIFKDYAQEKGYKLTEEQLVKVNQAWKGEVFADEPRAPAIIPRGGGGGPRLARLPAAARFDYNTEYAGTQRLLTWVKKPDSDGTRNAHGQGSYLEHQQENQARAYAKQGRIQDAIDEL